MGLLSQIQYPSDLRELSVEQLPQIIAPYLMAQTLLENKLNILQKIVMVMNG